MVVSQKILNQIRARKTLKSGKLRKLKKPPKWLLPLSQERQYERDLYSLTFELRRLIETMLVPALPSFIADVGMKTPDGPLGENTDAGWMDLLRGIVISIGELIQPKVENTIAQAALIGAEIASFNYQQFQKINRNVFGIDIFIRQPWLADQLTLFANQNAQLITSIPDQELLRVSGVVERGLQEGASLKTITEDVENSFGITRRRAKLIARDQTSKLNASLTKLRQQELGVESYEWQTSGDERVRPSHRKNDGKIFRWDDPPAETGHPGTDVNCRCVAIPILDGVIYEQSNNWPGNKS